MTTTRHIRPTYTGVDGAVSSRMARDDTPTASVEWTDPDGTNLHAELPTSFARDLARDLVANGHGPVTYAGRLRSTLADFR
jgi:hypothetical protein